MKKWPKQQKSELRANKKGSLYTLFPLGKPQAQNQLQKFIHKLKSGKISTPFFTSCPVILSISYRITDVDFSHGEARICSGLSN